MRPLALMRPELRISLRGLAWIISGTTPVLVHPQATATLISNEDRRAEGELARVGQQE
jgi:hypothetical protein